MKRGGHISIIAMAILGFAAFSGAGIETFGGANLASNHGRGRPSGLQGIKRPAPSLKEIVRGARSHVVLSSGGATIDVYAYAADESVSILPDSYCGGDKGDKTFGGHYQLIAVKGGAVAARRALDKDLWFVNGDFDWSRMHLVANPDGGFPFVAVYEYASCNIEKLFLYRADSAGGLHQIHSLLKDGRRLTWRWISNGGSVERTRGGEEQICWYVNTQGSDFCDRYRFDGQDFRQTASWIGMGGGYVPSGTRTGSPMPRDFARRALYEFLSALSARDYHTAAFYFRGGSATAGAAESRERISRRLKTYCLASTNACSDLFDLVDEPGFDKGPRMAFRAEYLDGARAASGARTLFRVEEFADGYKVVGLPSPLPPSN